MAQEAEGARDVGMVSRTPGASELGHVCGVVLDGIRVSVARAIGSHSCHGRQGQWAMCAVSRRRPHCACAAEKVNYLAHGRCVYCLNSLVGKTNNLAADWCEAAGAIKQR